MRQVTTRLALAGTTGMALIALAGCDSAGQQRNINQLDNYSQIISTGRVTELADLAGLTGTANYEGSAVAVFPASNPPDDDGPQPTFAATSSVALTADFGNGTLSGDMTNWTTEDPNNYDMSGRVRISEGAIDPDGSYTGVVSGWVERRETARKILDDRNSDEDGGLPRSYLVLVEGAVLGGFHDSLDGDRATHVTGEIVGPNIDGRFVARQ